MTGSSTPNARIRDSEKVTNYPKGRNAPKARDGEDNKKPKEVLYSALDRVSVPVVVRTFTGVFNARESVRS